MLAIDRLATEQAEIRDYQLVFRRLAAATVLAAISDLSSSLPATRSRAILYLLTEGTLMVRDLGMRVNLLDVIDNPPDKRKLKASNGRKPRAKTMGRLERKLGKRYQPAPGVII